METLKAWRFDSIYVNFFPLIKTVREWSDRGTGTPEPTENRRKIQEKSRVFMFIQYLPHWYRWTASASESPTRFNPAALTFIWVSHRDRPLPSPISPTTTALRSTPSNFAWKTFFFRTYIRIKKRIAQTWGNFFPQCFIFIIFHNWKYDFYSKLNNL